ncbi:MAG: hypothetical protein IPG34_15475 [Rhodocyclaceae bacterium]|nr:hypothetical protein [Rhodocyclaceae bacterium]
MIGDQTLCVGQATGDRTQELPEQAGPLADKPLVDTRNSGLNLDSQCARQSTVLAGAIKAGK